MWCEPIFHTKLRCYRSSIVAAALFISVSLFSAAVPVPPDLTQSNKVDRELTYNLGPTGLRGWIYTKPATYFDSMQGRTTAASRQILITHVGIGSPADGVMKVNDVILGVGGSLFTDDARKTFGIAIGEAEKVANQGILKLTRWRDGKTEDVQIKLKVMGSYSATAPYDCSKSQLILADACRILEKEPLKDDIWGAVNGLALLSTGKPEYLPRLQEYARKIAPQSLKLELKEGMVTWTWAYRNIFLSEYFLATGDKEVLHAINEYTIALAKGQSMYGTFGHGISSKTVDGKLHGSIPPYGPVNATGLPSNVAIVMGKKCGVNDSEVDPAIDRASKFFGYFVDKGSIPYGEHMPWPTHDNNGKNAMSALLFSLQGNQIRAAKYFSKMVTASYENREYGHTGQGFSYLWGAMGANAGGPLAAAAFFKESRWHLDLSRRSDGSFSYDGGEQYGPGKTEDNTYFGWSSYYGLSPTACYVLTYALPLKKICLTGRDATQANWLDSKDVTEAIVSGRFDIDCKKKSASELVAALEDWSPIVRGWAAEELGNRPESKAMVSQLMAMAEGKSAHGRQGACETLGFIKSAEALPVLVRLLTHEDRWLRVKAANALKRMGDTAKPVIPEMLKAVASTAEPLAPIVWDDPIQLTHGELAAALFKGLLRNSIKGVDSELLYPAIRAISRNADGMARSQLYQTFEKHLTIEDVRALGSDILIAIDEPAPADTMFGNEIRMAGLKALAKYHFKEGIRVSVKFAQTQSDHGSEKRTGEILKLLESYGIAAKEVLPDLRLLIEKFKTTKSFPSGPNKMRIASVEESIHRIEDTQEKPALRSLADKNEAR